MATIWMLFFCIHSRMLSSFLRPLQFSWKMLSCVLSLRRKLCLLFASIILHPEQHLQSNLLFRCSMECKLVQFRRTHPLRPHQTPYWFQLLRWQIAQGVGPGFVSMLPRIRSRANMFFRSLSTVCMDPVSSFPFVALARSTSSQPRNPGKQLYQPKKQEKTTKLLAGSPIF